MGGWAGFDVCDVCVHLEEEGGGVKSKLSQLVYTKSVFIKEVDRTGSVLFETGTFFCTKVIIKAQLLLIQGHYGWMISELKRIFFVLLFLETKKLSFLHD